MIPTTAVNEFLNVKLLKDEPKFNLKSGTVLQCQVNNFKIGNGWQVYTELSRIDKNADGSTSRVSQAPFHGSEKTEEGFYSRFEIIKEL